MLSGDKAYELFVSGAQYPLRDWLGECLRGEHDVAPQYVLAVIGAYSRMIDNCYDGRYENVFRKEV